MRKSKKSEGGSWMDTYGDMVTLLMCFFVLLYAISAVDQTKWVNLVKSLNPNAVETIESEVAVAEKETNNMDDVPHDFETLYENLKAEIEKNDLAKDIEIKKGAGFTFITFKSNVIFDPNSYILRDGAKKLLDDFCRILANYSDDIAQVQIMGHTAEVTPGQNNIANDRFLASNRAAAVLVYIQEKNIFDPVKLVSMGYGQYRPIADNSTPEGRDANRRVELLITKSDAALKSLDEYYQEIYVD